MRVFILLLLCLITGCSSNSTPNYYDAPICNGDTPECAAILVVTEIINAHQDETKK